MSVNSMKVEQLNMRLYEKVQSEQEAYVAELLKKSPEEILKSAREYCVRDDMVAELEFLNFKEPQVRGMLRSDTPLADMYEEWKNTEIPNMDDIRSVLSTHAENEGKKYERDVKRKNDRDAR